MARNFANFELKIANIYTCLLKFVGAQLARALEITISIKCQAT